MKTRIKDIPEDARRFLPDANDDNSGIGVNYADACLKALKTTLDDGRKVLAMRRGLKITLKVGDRQGEGLMRRLEHGPDVEAILEHALREAAASADLELSIDDGTVYIAGGD